MNDVIRWVCFAFVILIFAVAALVCENQSCKHDAEINAELNRIYTSGITKIGGHMKVTIDIPKEFEDHFNKDRFEDSLHRLSADANLLAGNYEQETAKMLTHALKNAEIKYE